MPTKEPFPFPNYENEGPYKARNSKKASYGVPAHLVQERNPWNRLYSTPTLASIRQEVWYKEPQASKDSLDFHLTALYNHHEDLLKDKSEVVLHKETIYDDHGALKGLEHEKVNGVSPVERPTSKGICVRHWVNPIKETIHSIDGAIESPHTAATNSGFSRKENGGIFYH